MQAFSLTKWYLDGVDADGRSAIAYWTRLSWRGLSICWHRLAVYGPGRQRLERSSAGDVPPPAVAGGSIDWYTPRLHARVTCRPRVPAFEHRLVDGQEGTVDWRCEAAHGDVTLECDGRMLLSGSGYAESLRMTLPPWRLPIDTLRWGRWTSESSPRSVVWIDWRGPRPLTMIFSDGRLQPDGEVGDGRVVAGDAALRLADRRTLYTRSLSDTVGALRPVLAPLVPASWLDLEDCKWRSLGTLQTPGRPDESGWVIHEEVRWPS